MIDPLSPILILAALVAVFAWGAVIGRMLTIEAMKPTPTPTPTRPASMEEKIMQ